MKTINEVAEKWGVTVDQVKQLKDAMCEVWDMVGCDYMSACGFFFLCRLHVGRQTVTRLACSCCGVPPCMCQRNQSDLWLLLGAV